MSEKSAETIRRAAALMRERAELAMCDGASQPPWKVAGRQSCGCCEVVADADGSQITAADDRQSAHIASWHPLVALAVADWLERDAALIDAQVFPQSDPVMERYPLKVARAYLGEESA